MKYRQVKLQDGTFHLTTNVPDHPKLAKGARITLKDEPERWWTVIWVSDNVREHSELNKQWNNNI